MYSNICAINSAGIASGTVLVVAANLTFYADRWGRDLRNASYLLLGTFFWVFRPTFGVISGQKRRNSDQKWTAMWPTFVYSSLLGKRVSFRMFIIYILLFNVFQTLSSQSHFGQIMPYLTPTNIFKPRMFFLNIIGGFECYDNEFGVLTIISWFRVL